ncbi:MULTISPECIES: metal-sulfur cluster assembly factor [Fructobacillus]|jgi:metal-sulfur cluster biosynthetic enzyme|uniref:Metal-sulfur cluster biosynthetic enzyme (PaaD) n=1 Tax=Fructobacillus tropaeoli TaxID=709323 RepID=A0ABM9MZI8_9LACO|nr:metal-sulfur cluster assembly factor [Fructobacillus tropaeoli]CAK1224396.1 Metal-sulfur cluster biosynthetic enzyme (PaaD) [Fructobacillus sp. LMG 32999]CAK1225866.1 Metal-sulfur cluster biosynthetic enzyme (PaaD) [Fructobacillus tropaeoli]CAK1228977.1 Metal-sulfur cluster biosynthetic enzyme (PaaD) [Fructobacillus tropaeoli]CAK1232279.1 Metal-sulfur cluster biosynthetic enzyme (PaaD) [Fructobacillus sp. LMG 32999]CAK1238138.1 Metal-sulfur cluster biosynthetic enzyme (PaaD) [Fructobacillus
MDAGKKEEIMLALSQVIDPDFRVDVVNLGFINEIDLNDQGLCLVNMTLTVIGCPIMGTLEEMVADALKIIDGVEEVKIEYRWEPAWSVERMSPYAKAMLGLS